MGVQISNFHMNLFNLGPHNKYRQYNNWAKVPSEFNQTEWLLRLPALLNEVRSYWQSRDTAFRSSTETAFGCAAAPQSWRASRTRPR